MFFEAFVFKGFDIFLKEVKKDFISEENILKLGLLWMTLLGLWEEEITQKIKQYC